MKQTNTRRTSPTISKPVGEIIPSRTILKALAPGVLLQLRISAFPYQWNMLEWFKMKSHKYKKYTKIPQTMTKRFF